MKLRKSIFSFYCHAFTSLFLSTLLIFVSSNALVQEDVTDLSYVIRIDLTKNSEKFEGALNITLRLAKRPLKEIRLDVVNITIPKNSIKLTDMYDTEFSVNKTVQDEKSLIITPKYGLSDSRKYKLSMNFTGSIHDDARGLFRSHFFADGTLQSLLATNLSPAYARYLLPCVDDPSQKSNFTLTFIHNRTSNIIFNTEIESSRKISPTKVKTMFKEAQNIPTHLIAFVIGDFKQLYKNETKKLTTWGLLSAKERLSEAHNLASDVVVKAEEITDVSLVWPHLNVVIIPNLPKNIIGAGLLLLSETSFSWTEELPTRIKQNFILSMAQMISTQWAGLQLWSETWGEEWIISGYVNLLKYKISAQIKPTWDLDIQKSIEFINTALSLDGTYFSRSLSEMDENSAGSDIVQNKGASILFMTENILNFSFWESTRKFFRESTYHITNEVKFVNVLENQAEEDHVLEPGVTVFNVVQSWSNQAGYPVVYAIRDYNNSTANISQKRFFWDEEDRESTMDDEAWWVPLWAIIEKSQWNDVKPKYWLVPLEPLTVEKILPPTEMPFFYIKQAGPFRVNYDLHNWNLLISRLNSPYMDEVPILSRAQLVTDALVLARGNLLPWNMALDAFSYLSAEKEYIPWNSILNAITFIKDRMQGTPVLGMFKKFMQRLTKTSFLDAQHNEESSFTHTQKLLKDKIFSWACWAGLQECENVVIPKFIEWQNDRSKKPSADILSSVLCTGIRQGNESQYLTLLERSLEEEISLLRHVYLSGLACASESFRPILLNTWMALIRDQGDINQNGLFFGQALLEFSDSLGPSIWLEVLQNKFEYVMVWSRARGEAVMLKMLNFLATKLNTEKELEEFVSLIENCDQSLRKLLEESIKMIKFNLDWRIKHLPEIENWLKVELNQN